MVSKYKLTYFNGRGIAESIRYLFLYGNIEFEDNRIPQENWPTIKPTLRWSQLPLLEIDGKTYNQSQAIARYIATQAGLSGKDAFEDFQINIASEAIHEYRIKSLEPFFEANEIARAEKVAALHSTYWPTILPKLDELAAENGGYFALGRVSYADFIFASCVEFINKNAGKNLLVDYKNLRQVVENVESIPSIKKWIAVRPVTDF